jgi:hypothetical protein
MELVALDQLSKEKRAMRVFSGFFEEDIQFPPTYRVNKDSMTYDTTEKMRVPSFTDRIMVYAKNRTSVQLKNYCANMDILISDHRPVFLHATVKLVEVEEGDDFPQGNQKSAVCNVA